MSDCVICGHARRDHYGSGCSRAGSLRADCACTYVDQPPLPPDASAEDHDTRSEWWHLQARSSWELAQEARYDLDRWHELMRFHRAARQAQLDERRAAFALDATSSSRERVAPGVAAFSIDSKQQRLPAVLSVGAVARA